MTEEIDIGKNYQAVLKRVKELNSNAVLVAVSKTKPVSDLKQAYDAGCRIFGENYVDEVISKGPKFPDCGFYFIGHLQSNKVNHLCKVENLAMIQTITSENLAKKINSRWPEPRPPLQVMIQVNTSGEAQKNGVNFSDIAPLAQFIINECPRLKFTGLMTIGEIGEAQRDFQVLIDQRNALSTVLNVPPESIALSMGMSADYELALQMGATYVRVGSTIFGARNYV